MIPEFKVGDTLTAARLNQLVSILNKDPRSPWSDSSGELAPPPEIPNAFDYIPIKNTEATDLNVGDIVVWNRETTFIPNRVMFHVEKYNDTDGVFNDTPIVVMARGIQDGYTGWGVIISDEPVPVNYEPSLSPTPSVGDVIGFDSAQVYVNYTGCEFIVVHVDTDDEVVWVVRNRGAKLVAADVTTAFDEADGTITEDVVVSYGGHAVGATIKMINLIATTTTTEKIFQGAVADYIWGVHLYSDTYALLQKVC